MTVPNSEIAHFIGFTTIAEGPMTRNRPLNDLFVCRETVRMGKPIGIQRMASAIQNNSVQVRARMLNSFCIRVSANKLNHLIHRS